MNDTTLTPHDILTEAESLAKRNGSVRAEIDSLFDLKTAPAIPESVYEQLPETIKTRLSLLKEDHHKGVVLVGVLPVIAAHMPNVLIPHADGYYTPDLFTLVVSNPASGKGKTNLSKKFGTVLNQYLIEQSRKEKQEHESLPKKTDPPRDRSLFIPANSSSRAIYDSLDANGGSGLLFETEIDTLLSATSQEWGNFSDLTRKAFHHESLSINRKNERYFIDNPRLSICLTGTFDQFKKMFESAENGHFSRYALYTFDTPRKWQSHRPTRNSRALNESIHTASESLFKLYQTLNRRSQALFIEMTDEQYDRIDETFAGVMQIIEELDLSVYLHASNNRAAVMAYRMAALFAVLRIHETHPERLATAQTLTPSERDLECALLIAETFIQHAIRLYQVLPKATNVDGKGERFKKFLVALPNEFATSQALEIGSEFEIPEPTVKRWLSTVSELTRIERGQYRKN